ncbi:Glycine cleavage system H protein [bacterium HR32]|nr:Glycine cleavage system H protein [bacterium HR32]
MSASTVRVGRYELAVDRLYDPEHHLWVLPVSDTRVRLGFDPLGVEVNGTLAQLVLAPVGTVVRRGEPFGSLEAAKFVGPLVAPVSGRVVAHNPLAVGDPAQVEQDPFGAGWLVELEVTAFPAERAYLLEGAERIVPWFRGRVEAYRRQGVLAE